MCAQYFKNVFSLILAMTLGFAVILPGAARAQELVFVQIESNATLTAAEGRARAYAQAVSDVSAFRTRSGLYAIALGPYVRADAQALLRDLRSRGLIPRDSFVTNGSPYAAQVFPFGGTALDVTPAAIPDTAPDIASTPDPVIAPAIAPAPLPDDAPEPTAPIMTEAAPPPAPAPEPEPASEPAPEETLEQARQSERTLDRPARDALQIALQWFGYYQGRIDGAFGRGTRNAMSGWQQDQGFTPTGVLSTTQRAQLLDSYQGELAALGMDTIRDTRAGIEIDLPLGLVAFDSYNFPFVQYGPTNDSGVQVLLISQAGDRSTLFGLYEIMQTLQIVPLTGTRERQSNRFLLTGQSDTLRSHTEASLTGGAVKGFTLVWPPEEDARMARVLPMMQASFRAVAGALDPGAVPPEVDNSVDLAAGLSVRLPERVRSGFYLDARGHVMTTAEAVEGACARILIDGAYPAEIALADAELGLAVLRPLQPLAPLSYADIASVPGRVRSDIAVAGFPFDGALGAASMAFGSLAELQGLNGERMIQRLDVTTSDSEAGGPVFDTTGSVLGMVLPGWVSGRALPKDVTLALRADLLGETLARANITPRASDRTEPLNRERLARLGAEMTVTVSCWN